MNAYWLGAVVTASLLRLRDPDPIAAFICTLIAALCWPVTWVTILYLAVTKR